MLAKKFIILLAFFSLPFAFTSFVQADGDHSNHSDISNAITNFQGNGQHPSIDDSPHSEMNHGESHEDQADIHSEGHSVDVDSEPQHSGHGEESIIDETPPNYIVLSTFGLINAGFLGLGIFLKIRKRKETIYEVE